MKTLALVTTLVCSVLFGAWVEPSTVDFCCTSCHYSGGMWSCSGCGEGSSCAGDVFTCLGEYSGAGDCSISPAANSCCT